MKFMTCASWVTYESEFENCSQCQNEVFDFLGSDPKMRCFEVYLKLASEAVRHAHQSTLLA